MYLEEFNGHFICIQAKEYVVTTNGIEKTYAVAYQPHLSSNMYTKKHVYYVKTEVESYHIAKKDILSIMNLVFNYKDLLSAGSHAMAKTIEQALKPYYKFNYNDELDMFEITIIEPYDD